MGIVTQQELTRVKTLDELYAKLPDIGMGPGWNKPTPAMWSEPKRSFKPVRFSYSQAKGALDAAGNLISTELAERRNLILFNPIQGNTYSTTRTLVAAYQMILPGEHARSHRHVPNALRLIVDAEPGVYTVVNGEKVPMSAGDVVLTPNWCWHGHGNEGNSAAYWIDFLDVPLVQLLEPMFFELHADGFESHAKPVATSSLLFPWRDMERQLAQASCASNGPGDIQIELGQPALSTIALYMIRLLPRVDTTRIKTTANDIYGVVKGSGITTVESEQFEWHRGDVIVVPSWHEHFHRSEDGAVLLRVTDSPVMTKLDLLRNANA